MLFRSNVRRAPEWVAARIREIPGVAVVETRVVANVTLDVPGLAEPAAGRLVSIPERGAPLLNALHLLRGRYPEPERRDEVVLSAAFAEKNGFEPGGELSAILNGRWTQLRIAGIALSPEYVYEIRPGDMFPDSRRFGVMWMNRKPMSAALDSESAFNNATFLLAPDVDQKQVLSAIDSVLEPYGGAGAYARAEQASHAFMDSEFRQLATMAGVIPQVFLVVASFLVYSVIARQIETQREEIGLLKAFGYADATIAMHFVKMALVTAVLGLVAGCIAGIWLAQLILDLYRQYFRFPSLELVISLDVIGFAALVSVAAASGGALVAVVGVMRLSPAVAMAPAAPARYRPGTMERLGLLRGIGSIGFMIVRQIGRAHV